jgi:hypothetical protein
MKKRLMQEAILPARINLVAITASVCPVSHRFASGKRSLNASGRQLERKIIRKIISEDWDFSNCIPIAIRKTSV